MSIYNYQLVEPLILPNTLISLSAISQESSIISYQLVYHLYAIFIKQSQKVQLITCVTIRFGKLNFNRQLT